MNIDKFVNSKVGGYVALGCVAAAVIYYLSKKAGAAFDLVNPMSGNNIANSAVTSAGRAITGDDGWTLGGAIYDFSHTELDMNDPNSHSGIDWESLLSVVNPASWAGTQLGKKVSSFDWSESLDFVDPTSDQNLAYRGVNAIGSAATGDTSFSLGGWIYDVFHPSQDNAPSNQKVDGDYRTWLNNNTDTIGEGW